VKNVLLVTSGTENMARSEALVICQQLTEAGVQCMVPGEDVSRFDSGANLQAYAQQDLDAVIVLGGDGTILRAAELVRDNPAPILGINLGHVGFMAEAERSEVSEVVARLLSGDFEITERTTLEVAVYQDEKEIFRSWALNEVAVEKSSRERMLEVAVEVDARPVSSFGCDGVLISTATGSTAYAFSAGGPVVWPNVEAFVVVPLSAHALFARPFVIDPASQVAIELLQRSVGRGVLWCDARRNFDLEPGTRVVVEKGNQSVQMVTLSRAPFADRLVRKFNLPVTGWRGPEAKD